MLKNYLKITARNILKHKGYSFINVSGLATGIACCLLIFIYVKGELTYDHFHSKKDNIQRVLSTLSFAGNESTMGASGYPEGQAYKEEIPEIEEIVRINNTSAVAQKGEEYLEQNRVVFADPSLFTVFDFKWLEGSSDGALEELNSVVLTRRAAIKYFGSTDVLGKTLRMNVHTELEDYYVTAVLENHPSNSSFNFDIVIPWEKHLSQLSEYRKNSWSNIGMNTFVLLTDGANASEVVEKMHAVRSARNPGEGGEFARGIAQSLQPLTDIHLNTEYRGGDGMGVSGDPVYAYVLSGIALIILIVACINFTNLSMARSLPRAKEIGVRKVLGARQKQLAFQFLNEALIMCFMAFIIGLIMAEMALPAFGNLTERVFYENITDDPVLMLLCLGLVMITALLSGFYPAFVISRFKTVTSLKGKVRLKGKSTVSKVLVVVQFTITAVLVIGTITMYQQINHMIDMDLGYNDRELLEVEADRAGVRDLHKLFKADLAQNPNILGVAASDGYTSYTSANWNDEEAFVTCYNEIDGDYFSLMELELVAGRALVQGEDFHVNSKGDTLRNILVNETYVKKWGEEDIVNKVTSDNYRVVGVVKDFLFSDATSEVLPLMLLPIEKGRERAMTQIFVKYRPEYLSEVRTVVGNIWRKHVPYRPYDVSFVAEANAARYADEVRWRNIITYAAVLAIIISALGLFGLAHLSTQQRIKEIGIRKVLGASLSHIILLLNSDFARLVLISVVLAAPAAYYFIDQWLQNFAYPVDITVMLFLLPGLLTFSIAFLTVSLQSFKQARTNPINAIRYE